MQQFHNLLASYRRDIHRNYRRLYFHQRRQELLHKQKARCESKERYAKNSWLRLQRAEDMRDSVCYSYSTPILAECSCGVETCTLEHLQIQLLEQLQAECTMTDETNGMSQRAIDLLKAIRDKMCLRNEQPLRPQRYLDTCWKVLFRNGRRSQRLVELLVDVSEYLLQNWGVLPHSHSVKNLLNCPQVSSACNKRRHRLLLAFLYEYKLIEKPHIDNMHYGQLVYDYVAYLQRCVEQRREEDTIDVYQVLIDKMYSWRDRFNADEWRDLLAMLINPQIVTGLERLIKDGYAGELLLYSLLQLFLEDDDLLRQFHSWLIILLEKHCPARSYTRQRWMQGLLKLLVELHKHVVLPKESQTQNDGCFQVTV